MKGEFKGCSDSVTRSIKSTSEIAAELEERATLEMVPGVAPGVANRIEKNYKAMLLEKSGLKLVNRDIYEMTHVELDYYLRVQGVQTDPTGSCQEMRNAWADFVQGTIKPDLFSTLTIPPSRAVRIGSGSFDFDYLRRAVERLIRETCKCWGIGIVGVVAVELSKLLDAHMHGALGFRNVHDNIFEERRHLKIPKNFEEKVAPRLSEKQLEIYVNAVAWKNGHDIQNWMRHQWTGLIGGIGRVEKIEVIGGATGYVAKYINKAGFEHFVICG